MGTKKIKLKRGLKKDLPILSYGEPAYVSDEKAIYIGTSEGNMLISRNYDSIVGGLTNLKTVEVEDKDLNLTTDRNQFATIVDGTRIQLPTPTTNFAEIHLWVKLTDDVAVTFPKIAWQSEPETYGGFVYEYIFTYVNGMWVGGFVSYEVGDVDA